MLVGCSMTDSYCSSRISTMCWPKFCFVLEVDNVLEPGLGLDCAKDGPILLVDDVVVWDGVWDSVWNECLGVLLRECPTALCNSALCHTSSSGSRDQTPGVPGGKRSTRTATPSELSTLKPHRGDAWNANNKFSEGGGRSTAFVGST